MATDSSKLFETSTAGHSHPSAAMLYVTFGVLMVLLAATVTADHFLEGVTGTVTGLSISVTKTALIVLIFMNLRWSSALIRLASIAAVLWLSFALMFVMGDYLTRGWNESEDHFMQEAVDTSSFQEMQQPFDTGGTSVR
ncbi:MAG: NADH-quinone oxidoreductase subunit H [Planctomycetaceae bacterium]|nr:NADH-quinone oxidoreductase subunit H [Planctomycetaceae bacterium]